MRVVAVVATVHAAAATVHAAAERVAVAVAVAAVVVVVEQKPRAPAPSAAAPFAKSGHIAKSGYIKRKILTCWKTRGYKCLGGELKVEGVRRREEELLREDDANGKIVRNTHGRRR